MIDWRAPSHGVGSSWLPSSITEKRDAATGYSENEGCPISQSPIVSCTGDLPSPTTAAKRVRMHSNATNCDSIQPVLSFFQCRPSARRFPCAQPASQAECRRFESGRPLQPLPDRRRSRHRQGPSRAPARRNRWPRLRRGALRSPLASSPVARSSAKSRLITEL